MARVNRNWAGNSFQRGIGARMQFIATGFTDAEQARCACDIQVGVSHDLDTTLIASEPSISTPNGPQNFVLDFDFAPSAGITFGGDATTSLLKTPPTYYPDVQQTKEPIDKDSYGNAITNSAGDPFSTNAQDDFASIFYVYERYEAKYDGAKAMAYSNKLNADVFDMPGFGRVAKGQAMCKSIRVAEKYNRETKAVLMVYTFEIREDGFDLRILDKGRRAWSSTGIDDIYVGANGKQVSDDVLLNGYGIPIKSDYVIGETRLTPAQKFDIISEGEVKRESRLSSAGLAVFLHYVIKKFLPFAGLNLEK